MLLLKCALSANADAAVDVCIYHNCFTANISSMAQEIPYPVDVYT